MSRSTSQKPKKDYEIPIVWHESIELDMAADLNLSKDIPVGGLERVSETMHTAEFDCMPPVALVVSLQIAEDIDQHEWDKQLKELLCALNELDAALGGRGFVLDRSHSQEKDNQAVLTLLPLEIASASDRLQAVANILCRMCNDDISRTSEEKQSSLNGNTATASKRFYNWRTAQNCALVQAEVCQVNLGDRK